MRARAEAAEETRRQILRAVMELYWQKLFPEITLDDVAQEAGVSVQTVLRHFGSREGLFAATELFGRDEVLKERAAPVGDVEAAVRGLFDHYEHRGDATLRLLAQEFWSERIRHVTDLGRATHRQWVAGAFAPQLGKQPEGDREALTDLLIVATDVYTWKLLRRDRGLERQQAEDRVRRMITAFLALPEEGA